MQISSLLLPQTIKKNLIFIYSVNIMMSKEELEKALKSFTGTQHYYEHFTGLLYTDGVKFLAENAGAYWLIDAIASWQIYPSVRAIRFQIWDLHVNPDRSAELTMREDIDKPIIIRQRIPFTDFPLDHIRLYLADNVLMLPSEY